MYTIEEELRNFLTRTPKRKGRPRLSENRLNQPISATLPTNDELAILERNKKIILDLFGMGNSFWPTLQDMADKYEGMETRERVRQIKKANYLDRLPKEPFPVVVNIASLIEERLFWLETDLLNVLEDRGLTGNLTYVQGAIEYLQTQDMVYEYIVCCPDLRRVTKDNYHSVSERFILHKDVLSEARTLLKKARGIQGRNGLGAFSFLGDNVSEANQSILKACISHDRNGWMYQSGDETWFAFSDSYNSLILHARKIFSLIESCKPDILANLMRNSLSGRSSKFEYPTEEVILEWILHNSAFRVTSGRVFFLMEADAEFSDIDMALINYMRGKSATDSQDVINHLEGLAFGGPSISKTVRTNSIIFVDRTSGRRNYSYTLVSDLDMEDDTSEQSFYEKIRERLDEIQDTDEEISSTRRLEQSILRHWVLQDNDHGCCAACGKTLPASALRAAHKKKRSRCNDNERKDPYIVFPLCTLGCDFLYESGYILISEGKITRGKPCLHDLGSFVKNLEGREVPDIWLQGSSAYFNNIEIQIDHSK